MPQWDITDDLIDKRWANYFIIEQVSFEHAIYIYHRKVNLYIGHVKGLRLLFQQGVIFTCDINIL